MATWNVTVRVPYMSGSEADMSKTYRVHNVTETDVDGNFLFLFSGSIQLAVFSADSLLAAFKED